MKKRRKRHEPSDDESTNDSAMYKLPHNSQEASHAVSSSSELNDQGADNESEEGYDAIKKSKERYHGSSDEKLPEDLDMDEKSDDPGVSKTVSSLEDALWNDNSEESGVEDPKQVKRKRTRYVRPPGAFRCSQSVIVSRQ